LTQDREADLANATAAHTIWHLDEVYLKIEGRLVYLWCAMERRGEVLDVLVQTRKEQSAPQFDANTFEEIRFAPDKLVTDDLRSSRAAASELWTHKRHERVDGATIEREFAPSRPDEGEEDARVQSVGSAQRFFSVHAAAYNTTNVSATPSPQQRNSPSLRASAMHDVAREGSSLRREPDRVKELSLRLYLAIVTEPFQGVAPESTRLGLGFSNRHRL